MMIIAEMAAFDNVKELTEMAGELVTFVRQAAVEGTAAHEVEKGVWQRILVIGRQATGHFLQMQGDGDVGETIEMPDGERLKRLPEPHRRTYHSIFGPFGLSLPVDSLERMSRKMGESVVGFRTTLKRPPAKEEGEILVVTADGKGIPMRRPVDQRPVGARRKKGEKANKKPMATLGCVYTVDPKHRTPEDVVEALFREHPVRHPDETVEPVAQHKRVWSSLTYDEGDTHVDAETEVFTRKGAARPVGGEAEETDSDLQLLPSQPPSHALRGVSFRRISDRQWRD